MDFASSARTAKYRTRWKGPVAKPLVGHDIREDRHNSKANSVNPAFVCVLRRGAAEGGGVFRSLDGI